MGVQIRALLVHVVGAACVAHLPSSMASTVEAGHGTAPPQAPTLVDHAIASGSPPLYLDGAWEATHRTAPTPPTDTFARKDNMVPTNR